MRRFILKIGSDLCLIAAFVLLSGCFEIEEKATFQKDGSGSYTLEFHYKKGSDLYLELAEQSEYGEANAIFEVLKEQLRSLKGISHLKYFADAEQGVEGITFHFSNLKSLNKAMQLKNNEKYFPDNYFALDGKTFRRSNTVHGFFPNDPDEEEIVELKEDLDDPEALGLYESLVYRSVFTFDRTIATCSGKNTAISADGKEFSSAFTLLDFINEGNVLLENHVTFK